MKRTLLAMTLGSSLLALAGGCATPITVTKTWTEEIGPDGKIRTVRSESVVQSQQSYRDLKLEHIK